MLIPLNIRMDSQTYDVLSAELVNISIGDKAYLKNDTLYLPEYIKWNGEWRSPYHEVADWGNKAVIYHCRPIFNFEPKEIDFHWREILERGSLLKKGSYDSFLNHCRIYGLLGWDKALEEQTYRIDVEEGVEGDFYLYEPIGWMQYRFDFIERLIMVLELIKAFEVSTERGRRVKQEVLFSMKEIVLGPLKRATSVPPSVPIISNKADWCSLEYFPRYDKMKKRIKPMESEVFVYCREAVVDFFDRWFAKVKIEPYFLRDGRAGLNIDVLASTLFDATIGDIYRRETLFGNNVCLACGNPIARGNKYCDDTCAQRYLKKERRKGRYGEIDAKFLTYSARIRDRYPVGKEREIKRTELYLIKKEAGTVEEFVRLAEDILPRIKGNN